MTDTLFYTSYDSPIGRLLLVASNRGLRLVRLVSAETNEAAFAQSLYPQASLQELPGFFGQTINALNAYLTQGRRLSLPVDLAEGTPLQRAVWLAIARVPYGETISYTTLADRVGFPRAIRAVASACGANPVPLAIPCHRIIAKDGSLGGFSLGGLEVKETLLALERRQQAAVA